MFLGEDTNKLMKYMKKLKCEYHEKRNTDKKDELQEEMKNLKDKIAKQSDRHEKSDRRNNISIFNVNEIEENKEKLINLAKQMMSTKLDVTLSESDTNCINRIGKLIKDRQSETYFSRIDIATENSDVLRDYVTKKKIERHHPIYYKSSAENRA